MGSNITMTGNSCINGSVTIGPPNYFSSINDVIATNQITIPGRIGAPLTQVNQKAIMAAGYPPLSSAITQVIKQSAQTFSAAGGSLTTLTFQPRVSATPPLMVVAGMTGLTTNQYQNWAFTLACAANGGIAAPLSFTRTPPRVCPLSIRSPCLKHSSLKETTQRGTALIVLVVRLSRAHRQRRYTLERLTRIKNISPAASMVWWESERLHNRLRKHRQHRDQRNGTCQQHDCNRN